MKHIFPVIKKALSLSLSVKIIAMVAGATALSGILFYSTANRIALEPSYGSVISNAGIYKAEILKKSFYIYTLFTLLTLAGVAALGTLYSHRIAGPLQRVKAVSKEIAGGNLDAHVRFRREDFIHPLSDSLNLMAQRYRTRYEAMRKAAEKMQSDMQVLEAAVKDGNREEADKAVDAITASSRDVGRILSEIRL